MKPAPPVTTIMAGIRVADVRSGIGAHPCFEADFTTGPQAAVARYSR
jgi:hypothetical protein